MKKLDEITIADLMPDSISGDREVSATSRAIDPQLKVISEGVDLPLILASIDTLSEGVLEHLAAQYDLTAWDSAWPIDTKRAVLKTAIADKRKKGTRGAVQRAIEAVAPLAAITEWWEKTPQGTPHTFEIDVLQDGEAVDAETVADVIAQVNDSKPVRSHFTFSVGQQAQGNLYLSGVIRTIAYARVRSSGMTAVQTEIDAGVLAALRGMNIRRIMEFSHMGDMPEPTPPVAEYLDLVVGIVYSDGTWLSRTFGSNDYWYSGILSNDDKLRLEAFGSGATEPGGSFGPIGNVFYDSRLLEYEVKALYSDLGSTEIITDISNFFVRAGGAYNTSAFINSINAFSTPVMSWKLRITKKQIRKAYTRTNKTDTYLFRNTPSNVYDSDGNTIPYIDTNLLGVFRADGTSLGTGGFQLTNNGGLLALNYYGGSGTYAGYAEYTIL